ncbi:MAG: ABC transporter permease subunit [Trueperaceae bacterium]|nr:ABC transporter permease subunit [Trueperaceae bacterium]
MIPLGKSLAVLVSFVFLPLSFAQGDFVRIPNGWLWFLIIFIVVTGGIALGAYLYGKATRPGKAGQYALTAATHMFIWVVILLTFYPVIYLLAISLNENDSITSALPTTGNILFRSGVLPDPAKFSFIQYQKVLGETHLLSYQWILVVIFLGAALFALWTLFSERMGGSIHRLERLRGYAGWVIFLSLAVLVITINPSQFYFINEAGQRVASSTERKIVLYIRNTLLVSGATGIFAVLISTTAGYAFARMRFQGRYQTLLGFVFVQMFPGFMALVAIFYLMSYLGLLNTYAGLILAYSGGAISFAAWIFKGYLDSISPSLEEAARVDGATRWGAFWRIILPVSIPMLLFIFLLQFIGTYSEFIMANILLTGENQWTVGVGLRNFTNGRFNTQWGALAASAVLGSIPILVIFYSFQNALTGQHTAGGVKG